MRAPHDEPRSALGAALAAAGLAILVAGCDERPVEAAPAPAADAAGSDAEAPKPSAPQGPGTFATELDARVFQKGNLHTHTKFSDGDSRPEDVYRWYRRHGYAFVAVTDHNHLTPPATYRAYARRGFAILAGEEITTTAGPAHASVHVNALCEQRTVGGRHFDDPVAALRWAIGEAHTQGGVALVNHPNFEWALRAEDVSAAAPFELLEIWSGHEGVRAEGDEAHPSEEAIWDAVLTEGKDVAGVAVDDMHHLWTSPRGTPIVRPGRGWVQVFADAPTPATLCDALAHGRLYASNGAELSRIAVTRDRYAVWPAAPGATVEMIGGGGRVLATEVPAPGQEASYDLRGGEGYVRARVTAANGKRAWAPAVRALPPAP